MTGVLLWCAAILVLAGALYVLLAYEHVVAALWYRLDRDPDVYPPEAAPDPVDEHFGSIYVESDHPRDCAKACCWEIRLNELVHQYDWHAAEYEMRKTK